jgi:glutamyl-tRNA reductase
MPVVVIGLNHRTAPVTVREKFAFPPGMIPTSLERLREDGLAQEAVILSTCNRVELYAVTPADDHSTFRGLEQFLTGCHNYSEPLDEVLYAFGEPRSLEHLFRVACGMDSMVLGETEILGQLKAAYELALKHRHTGGRLNKAFQKAFNVAKHIRTETQIQRGAVSVANVAVELAEKIFITLAGRQVMVIGAGDTSEKTAKALLSRGASTLLVTNRTYQTAVTLAAALGGRAVSFDAWADVFAEVDIVVSSTSAPHYVLDRAKLEPLLKLRRNEPLLLIDIAVPRDIDPEINYVENVYLYNIDDLQAIADDYLKQRQEEIVRCEQIIREKVKELLSVRPAFGRVETPKEVRSAECSLGAEAQ